MLTDHRCTKYTDCSSCSFYQRDIFKYRLYPKGYVIPQTRCMQNMVFFLIKGEIWLNSEEHPDTTFRGGQFVLQPIGSKVECKVLDYTECIIYLFERPQNICDNRFNKGVSIVENERQQPIVMTMVPPIQLFIEGMRLYLNDDLRCSGLMQAKRSEMVYLLNCYYPIKELAAFYAPIYRYSHSFQYFVTKLPKGERRGDLRPIGRLQRTHLPPYLQGYVRGARLSMDAETQMPRHPQRPHHDRAFDLRDLLQIRIRVFVELLPFLPGEFWPISPCRSLLER